MSAAVTKSLHMRVVTQFGEAGAWNALLMARNRDGKTSAQAVKRVLLSVVRWCYPSALMSVSRDFVKGAAVGGALGAAVAFFLALRAGNKAEVAASSGGAAPEGTVSTTNSGLVAAASGSGGNVYETTTAVTEYIMFHYAEPADILPYAVGPQNALQFAERSGVSALCPVSTVFSCVSVGIRRTAAICNAIATKYGVPLDRALDVGCAVGGATFQLSKYFKEAVGVDFSHAFVNTSNVLKVCLLFSGCLIAPRASVCGANGLMPSGRHRLHVLAPAGEAAAGVHVHH